MSAAPWSTSGDVLDRGSPTCAVWLFSPRVDVLVFGGSALLSLLLLGYGAMTGLLYSDTPEWAWVPFVLLIDVAHVYATGFRVYFDRDECTRRPWLYFGTPILAFVIGVAIHSESSLWFWRVLAYLAVFHFVRQQYGWVAMYRAKAGEPGGWEKWIDATAIYLATIHPLIYWHAHLPRNFWWLREMDFHAMPLGISHVSAVVYWVALGAYAAKAVWHWRIGRANPGKDLVVATTFLCWRLGIITFNSDYAFTVTNVIIHGVPYFALVALYWRNCRTRQEQRKTSWSTLVIGILATAWFLAYVEELFWDRFIWQSRGWLFGSPIEMEETAVVWLAPLLATPQLTHYILDGFIWRRRDNPQMGKLSRSQDPIDLDE